MYKKFFWISWGSLDEIINYATNSFFFYFHLSRNRISLLLIGSTKNRKSNTKQISSFCFTTVHCPSFKLLFRWKILSKLATNKLISWQCWKGVKFKKDWILLEYTTVLNIGTSVWRSSGRCSGVVVWAVDCWQWRSGH